jgi:hypothetical protein
VYFWGVNATEQVVEKLKALPAFQAEAVLKFISELSDLPVLKASQLMGMAPADRRRILASQARQAEALYRGNPEMIVEEVEPPVSYG